MADGDLRPHGTQRHHRAGILDIRTGDSGPSGQQNTGDTRHPRPTNTDEVDTGQINGGAHDGCSPGLFKTDVRESLRSLMMRSARIADTWPASLPAAAAAIAL